MNNNLISSVKQIEWISSLRGLLVFLVFFSHLTILPIPKDLLFIIGRVGVAGFFLISGYLAVNSLKRRNNRQFLFNRFMRIYPIYWILLIMVFLLSEKYDFKEWFWNMTLFEEFVGYDAMIGSSWMLPIMIIFFISLLLINKIGGVTSLFYISCIGSLLIAVVRYLTEKPFPTALCLLICVGLIGFMQKDSKGIFDKSFIIKLIVFEVILVSASALSYGEKVYWYFIAYNLSFAVYFLFQNYNISIRVFEKLGELGFTFFLGANIPMNLLKIFVPDLYDWNCYLLAVTQFLLAIVFSYLITKYCEKPLLSWGKQLEVRLK